MDQERLREMMEYYRMQGAPQDQQMLAALLREAQEAEGGLLTQGTLDAVCVGYGLKEAVLQALIRRIPSLRCETAAHKLEICGSCRAGAGLRAFVEETYQVKSGGVSEKGAFAYRVTGCMKNCKNGPSLRWDGTLYSGADEALVRRLTGKG